MQEPQQPTKEMKKVIRPLRTRIKLFLDVTNDIKYQTCENQIDPDILDVTNILLNKIRPGQIRSCCFRFPRCDK